MIHCRFLIVTIHTFKIYVPYFAIDIKAIHFEGAMELKFFILSRSYAYVMCCHFASTLDDAIVDTKVSKSKIFQPCKRIQLRFELL